MKRSCGGGGGGSEPQVLRPEAPGNLRSLAYLASSASEGHQLVSLRGSPAGSTQGSGGGRERRPQRPPPALALDHSSLGQSSALGSERQSSSAFSSNLSTTSGPKSCRSSYTVQSPRSCDVSETSSRRQSCMSSAGTTLSFTLSTASPRRQELTENYHEDIFQGAAGSPTWHTQLRKKGDKHEDNAEDLAAGDRQRMLTRTRKKKAIPCRATESKLPLRTQAQDVEMLSAASASNVGSSDIHPAGLPCDKKMLTQLRKSPVLEGTCHASTAKKVIFCVDSTSDADQRSSFQEGTENCAGKSSIRLEKSVGLARSLFEGVPSPRGASATRLEDNPITPRGDGHASAVEEPRRRCKKVFHSDWRSRSVVGEVVFGTPQRSPMSAQDGAITKARVGLFEPPPRP